MVHQTVSPSTPTTSSLTYEPIDWQIDVRDASGLMPSWTITSGSTNGSGALEHMDGYNSRHLRQDVVPSWPAYNGNDRELTFVLSSPSHSIEPAVCSVRVMPGNPWSSVCTGPSCGGCAVACDPAVVPSCPTMDWGLRLMTKAGTLASTAAGTGIVCNATAEFKGPKDSEYKPAEFATGPVHAETVKGIVKFSGVAFAKAGDLRVTTHCDCQTCDPADPIRTGFVSAFTVYPGAPSQMQCTATPGDSHSDLESCWTWCDAHKVTVLRHATSAATTTTPHARAMTHRWLESQGAATTRALHCAPGPGTSPTWEPLLLPQGRCSRAKASAPRFPSRMRSGTTQTPWACL